MTRREAPQHMMTAYVRSLADEGFGLSEIGGKGQSLARLASAGLPVPDELSSRLTRPMPRAYQAVVRILPTESN